MALENDMDPSPVCPEAFKEVNWGSDVCALLRNLLLTNQKLGAFFEWMFKPPGDPPAAPVVPCNLSTQFAAQLIGLANPIGSGFWSAIDLDLDPREWVEAKGQAVLREGDYANLYKVFGVKFDPVGYSDDTRFHLPDLKGRFLLNRGQRDPFVDNEGVTHTYPNYDLINPLGGNDTATLTPEQSGIMDHMLEHQHGIGGTEDIQLAGGNSETYGLRMITEENPDDEDEYVIKSYAAGASYMAARMLANPDPRTEAKEYSKYNFVSGEPIKELLPDLEDEDVENPAVPHSIMPPYIVGIYYIRANYVINGEIIKLKSA